LNLRSTEPARSRHQNNTVPWLQSVGAAQIKVPAADEIILGDAPESKDLP